jgi:aldose 1-epimerase
MTLETISLHHAASGARAMILRGMGFNCYSFQAAVAGEPVETLWAADDFTTGKARASHSGIPLLFPFAGRLRGTQFTFQGRQYTLPAGDGIGNAIHGFVLDRPWRVLEQTAARVVGEFQASRDDASILDHWPADFRITVSYELDGPSLTSDIKIENPDSRPLPFGLGTHPYLRVPLGAGGNADDCVVTVPADEYWELVGMLPTGKRLPAQGARALSGGMRFADTRLDDEFSGLSFVGGTARATIEDPHSKRTLAIEFDRQFQVCVVYNPPHRQAICLEPYTCATDTFALAEQGIETGLRVLAAGEVFATRVVIRLE